MSAEDRLQLLLNQSALTGIDFVYVYASQDRLDVFFLRAPETLDVPLPGSLPRSAVRIENVRDANVPDVIITSVSWAVVDGRTVMRLDVVRPASFAPHRLTLTDPAAPSRIDPFFSSKVFSFQANCETGLDCEPDDRCRCPETYVDFPVDYSARDFHTFRQALLDYASQRYPQWLDRLEADVGVMLVEVMAALGDELAYSQDAISREAYLATASQRRSLRQLARRRLRAVRRPIGQHAPRYHMQSRRERRRPDRHAGERRGWRVHVRGRRRPVRHKRRLHRRFGA
ncbi:MAG: hypothetical protein HND48_21810 [Chloroflexi bacterium]|nr:hypothetical protein [Chloroflexota bacterium]